MYVFIWSVCFCMVQISLLRIQSVLLNGCLLVWFIKIMVYGCGCGEVDWWLSWDTIAGMIVCVPTWLLFFLANGFSFVGLVFGTASLFRLVAGDSLLSLRCLRVIGWWNLFWKIWISSSLNCFSFPKPPRCGFFWNFHGKWLFVLQDEMGLLY